MINMCYEVVESIIEYYKDDKEYIKEILFYLYHTTQDKHMKDKIVDWFEDNEYCVNCGEKLIYRQYEEHHTELYGNPIEYIGEYLCPNCD